MRSRAALAFLACALLERSASADPPRNVCVPGTPYCASTDANGGIHVQGQVGPGGASASGTANGYGGYRQQGWRPVAPPPPQPAPHGRFGVGVGGCPAVRAGLWSGFKGGGCVAVSFRFESLAFEMESQLLYGGTTHAFDWSFPMSFLVPLGHRETLFEGLYLRFGGSPVGATFAKKEDGGSFVRFGVLAGIGYELAVNRVVTWRIVDARASFDLGTKRALDRLDHVFDPGVQLSTGLVF